MASETKFRARVLRMLKEAQEDLDQAKETATDKDNLCLVSLESEIRGARSSLDIAHDLLANYIREKEPELARFLKSSQIS